MTKISNQNLIIGILAIVIIGLIGIGFWFCKGKPEPGTGLTEISAQEAGQKAIDFINQNLTQEGQTASLVNVSSTNGVYQVKLKLRQKEYSSYVTKDGKFLFPQGFDLKQQQTKGGGDQGNQSAQIPKQDTSEVELFVMSFCPFGGKAEDTMEPVYELLGDKVNWKIHYIVSKRNGSFSSLHGEKEVAQDKRELCVLNNHGLDKWFDFATYVNENCGSDGNCWKEAAEKVGLNSASIAGCTEESGADFLAREAKATQQEGASGSPTLFVNGVESQAVYNYGSPNAYKEAICSGFKEAPAECEQELASQNSNTSGGSCE